MSIFNLLSFVGGLALFLFGMDVMGEALKNFSGGELQKRLGNMTSSTVKGVLLGAGVTAVIQSSSATTVMVVGFVNSGIMTLHQAVGVIMGANIGTTMTSWLLSLVSVSGDSFFMQMLKPSSFSPVLAMIGVILRFASHSDRKKNAGTIMLGFAVLMIGMNTMSGAVEPLSKIPDFINLFTKFSNPVLGVLVGLTLTAIIQSSSASVGILQALCTTGAVTYGAAIPIIMGQNIGTCVTALLSAIGASKNAKRAAMIHLYFNIIGTILFMTVFYSLNAFLSFAFLKNVADPAGIAVIHSTFNIAATAVLLPFSWVLEKLATATIRDGHEHAEEEDMDPFLKKLDNRFLNQPSVAISVSIDAVFKMADYAREAVETAMSLFDNYDEETAAKVKKLEKTTDRFEDRIGTYILGITPQALSEKESHQTTIILRSIGDLERIGDHAVNLRDSALEMVTKNQHFSNNGAEDMRVMMNAVRELLRITGESLKQLTPDAAERIEPLEEVVDDLSYELKSRHIIRLRNGICSVEMGFVLEDMTTNLERIADHCSNIGVTLAQEDMNVDRRHETKRAIKDQNSFKEEYTKYQHMFPLDEAIN